MSRFSSVLFAVGFGLFASLTTLVSCGDTSDDPIDTPSKEESTHKASDSASKGLPGIYKLEMTFQSELPSLASLDVTALYDITKCSPLFAAYADSIVSAKKTKVGKDYARVSVKVSALESPYLFKSPFILTTLPNAHGLAVNFFPFNTEGDCLVQVKEYYNGVLLLNKIVNLADYPLRSLSVTMGHPAVDLMKPLENPFQIE